MTHDCMFLSLVLDGPSSSGNGAVPGEAASPVGNLYKVRVVWNLRIFSKYIYLIDSSE